MDVLGTIGAVSFGNGTVSTMFVMFLAVLAATASVMQKLEQIYVYLFYLKSVINEIFVTLLFLPNTETYSETNNKNDYHHKYLPFL